MATKNFTQFNTATPLLTSDYIVGYNAALSAEIKTQIQDIINLVGESDSQTLSYDGNNNLSISSGNSVVLSGFNTINAATLLSGGIDLKNIFLTTETDSQTLSFNENNKNLTISSGNTVSLSALSDTAFASASSSFASTNFVQTNFFPLTGGTISGETRINNNLTVNGNLTATGTTTFANTVFSTTSSLSVVHVGSGPAMWVGNNGDGDIASFYDIDQNVEILHVGGNNGTFPNVGVKTSQPNKDFTVVGEISATSHITTSGKFYGEGSSITNAVVTGKTIYVDANAGNDTRGTLSKYSAGSPFATIAAAAAASVTGDLVYVRAGTYTITSQINLDGKGNIYFETGTEVTVSGTVVAFSLTVNEAKTINGSANITLTNTAGVLSQTNGTITLEYNNIVSTSTGTLFTVSGGTLNTSFASISASTTDGFLLTGSASLLIRRSHTATCKQFLNCNTTGGVTIDLWTAVGTSTDSTIRVANVAGFSHRGVNLNNNSNRPCVIFAYSATGAAPVLRNLRLQTGGAPIVCENSGTFRDVFLDSIKLNSTNTSNPSISSSPSSTTIYSTTTYSNVLPHSSITVDGQYNIMTKIF